MLFVGFGQDHGSGQCTRAIVKKYRQSEAITEYVEFADRPHFPGTGMGARCRSRPRLGCRPRHGPVAVALTERPSTTWKWATRTVAPRASSEGAGLFVVALLGATAACGAQADLRTVQPLDTATLDTTSMFTAVPTKPSLPRRFSMLAAGARAVARR